MNDYCWPWADVPWPPKGGGDRLHLSGWHFIGREVGHRQGSAEASTAGAAVTRVPQRRPDGPRSGLGKPPSRGTEPPRKAAELSALRRSYGPRCRGRRTAAARGPRAGGEARSGRPRAQSPSGALPVAHSPPPPGTRTTQGAARAPGVPSSADPQHPALPSHSSLRPQSSPTCNCSLRSLHPSLAASAGLTAIGLNRCPVSASPSVTGVIRGLSALVPPSARREAPPLVTSRAAAERGAQRRASVSAPSPSLLETAAGPGKPALPVGGASCASPSAPPPPPRRREEGGGATPASAPSEPG